MENGKGAIATDLVNHIGFGSTEFHVLRPSEKINKEWLYYLTKTKTFRKQAEENMTGSAGQKRVPKKFWKTTRLMSLIQIHWNNSLKLLEKCSPLKRFLLKA
ncbi:hypothetical protein P5G51_006940 [Virgibacillus sp. 179-BFC.A HS]|uniref:Uncharacterized protein n=1 Tax=Tigheibacillus jepli TaxID=3035914 RepID=A0ABU5CI33_9BACI|nr:hypothetical protein [Virgibacillus sp. 179-BFC.A HS]MDY0405173.1 hypothetical protein [Virgibacillus sp. 179-BFC.A HS]